jgi:hypothetical protein
MSFWGVPEIKPAKPNASIDASSKIGFPLCNAFPAQSVHKKIMSTHLIAAPSIPSFCIAVGFLVFCRDDPSLFLCVPVLLQIEQTEKMVAEPLVHAALWYEKNK